MTLTVDLPTPPRALAIGAHADDIEFGCGATLAKWARAGSEVHLCVCTDGSKGTWDEHADVTMLAAQREREQQDAADALGAAGVHFLRFVDGELDHGLAARGAVARVIRAVQPDVVLGHDPWRTHRLHPDHRHAGLLAIEGIVAARDPHFYREHDIAPHRPDVLLLFEPSRVDHVEQIDESFAAKVAALLAHRSQWRSTMGIEGEAPAQRDAFVDRLRSDAVIAGLRAGVRLGEAFGRIDSL